MMKVDLYRCIYLIVVWLVASLGRCDEEKAMKDQDSLERLANSNTGLLTNMKLHDVFYTFD
jgi:hypothetical protein